MATRITFNMDEFPDTWVDVSDAWTRTEYMTLLDVTGDDWAALFRDKVEACNIPVGDDYITDPADVTEDVLNGADMRVLGFLDGAMLEAVKRLRRLGFTRGLTSSAGSAGTKEKAN